MQDLSLFYVSLKIVNFSSEQNIKPQLQCYLMEKDYCKEDSDCVCRKNPNFFGSEEYYNLCINTTKEENVWGHFCDRQPSACINSHCSSDYPKNDWTLRDCENLKSKQTNYACKKGVIFNTIKDDILLCDQLNIDDKINCQNLYYKRIADEKGDPKICENISKGYNRNECFEQFAFKTGDISFCDVWNKKSTRIGDCYIKVAIATNNDEICKMLEPKTYEYAYSMEDCYFAFAKAKINETICKEKIENNLRKEQCYIEVARLKEDSSICENVQQDQNKKICYQVVANHIEGYVVSWNEKK